MRRIELRQPTDVALSEILAYKRAFSAKNLIIDGSHGLDRFDDENLSAWFEYLNAPAGTNLFGYEIVESTTLVAWHLEQQKMVGIINIRHQLNDFILKFGGHIGYSIHPDWWNQGYGSEMLALALPECDKLGIENVLITCAKTNIGSAKVILKNGGVLENEVEAGGKIVQRYWITR